MPVPDTTDRWLTETNKPSGREESESVGKCIWQPLAPKGATEKHLVQRNKAFRCFWDVEFVARQLVASEAAQVVGGRRARRSARRAAA